MFSHWNRLLQSCIQLSLLTISCINQGNGLRLLILRDQLLYSAAAWPSGLGAGLSRRTGGQGVGLHGFNFEQTRTETVIWRAQYKGQYTMMAKPIKALGLHYPIIQILIIIIKYPFLFYSGHNIADCFYDLYDIPFSIVQIALKLKYSCSVSKQWIGQVLIILSVIISPVLPKQLSYRVCCSFDFCYYQ